MFVIKNVCILDEQDVADPRNTAMNGHFSVMNEEVLAVLKNLVSLSPCECDGLMHVERVVVVEPRGMVQNGSHVVG